jgi:hypothetical protein
MVNRQEGTRAVTFGIGGSRYHEWRYTDRFDSYRCTRTNPGLNGSFKPYVAELSSMANDFFRWWTSGLSPTTRPSRETHLDSGTPESDSEIKKKDAGWALAVSFWRCRLQGGALCAPAVRSVLRSVAESGGGLFPFQSWRIAGTSVGVLRLSSHDVMFAHVRWVIRESP